MPTGLPSPPVEEEHWCIKTKCNHGTLNGSLHYGSSLLESYNQGYAQGRADLLQDIEEGNETRVSERTRSNTAGKS